MTTALRLGFDPEFTPLTWSDAGRPAGRAIEIVCAAGARAGITLELVAVGLGAPDSVGELRLDGFACMAVTPGRTEFTFSFAYMTTAAALFFALRRAGQEESAEVEETAGGETGITVVTPRAGPLYGLLSEGMDAGRPPLGARPVMVARVVPATGYQDCLRRVLQGEADAAALNAEVGRTLVARLFPGAFFDVPAPLPDLGLAVALTGEPRAARLVLDTLDPALHAGRRDAGGR
jgi:ABC-type amino acid transport substrate-binding protein